jgi:hypothetical protein
LEWAVCTVVKKSCLARWERLGPVEVFGTGRVSSVRSESKAVEANGKG